jgi:hypothetical protein
MSALAYIEPFLEFSSEDISRAIQLHPEDSKGRIQLCHKTPREGWKEISVLPSELEYVLRQFPSTDSYISQNRFARKRRLTANLLELNAIWSDIDFRDIPELADKHPEYVLDLCLFELHKNKIPEPSLVVFSGRGLYLIWLHSPAPFSKVTQWQSAINRIHRILKEFGADAKAKDET